MPDLSDFHGKSRIDAGDVIALRRIVYPDGLIGAEEARALLSLAVAVPEGAPEWPAFLAEAMADHLVHQATPPGFVSDSGAALVIDAFGPAEAAPSTAIAVLKGIARVAREIPAPLGAYALAVLRAQVMADGIIDEDEVETLRGFLFAAGGPEGVAVTREEADFLFDLNDAAPVARTSAWPTLFADAVSAHLMAYWGGARLSREDALRLHRFAEGNGGIRWQTLLSPSQLRRAPSALLARTGTEALCAALNQARAAGQADAAGISAAEADWLLARLSGKTEQTVAEKALLDRLAHRAQEEGVSLPQAVASLLAA